MYRLLRSKNQKSFVCTHTECKETKKKREDLPKCLQAKSKLNEKNSNKNPKEGPNYKRKKKKREKIEQERQKESTLPPFQLLSI
mmetsp:Transcript_18143/g.36808  ORF Transcript_18143/g.36808 Transcript_18143/m.36808 type:complete len:84 (-) Transcript_18143:872-1123(-)